jgi:hypothetical protein
VVWHIRRMDALVGVSYNLVREDELEVNGIIDNVTNLRKGMRTSWASHTIDKLARARCSVKFKPDWYWQRLQGRDGSGT